MELFANGIMLAGWIILVLGSIYLFVIGRSVYLKVSKGLIGKFSKTITLTMLLQMYALGVVATALLIESPNHTSLVLPVFVVWLVSFFATIAEIKRAKKEMDNLSK